MNCPHRWLLALLFSLIGLGTTPISLAQPELPPQFNKASSTHWVSGQPTAAHLATLKTLGIGHLINLRPASEHPLQTSEAASLGLGHAHLPVAGPQSLTPETVAAFNRLLNDAGTTPTLIHCASGNRVGALMALRAAWIEGDSAEAALEIGHRYGLTGLESAVRERLGHPE